MVRKRYKIFGLIIFLLLLCAGLAALSYVFIQEHRQGASLSDAIETFDAGHFVEARKKFRKILLNDKNQELACVYLAKISGKEGNWQESVVYWQKAASLNPLEEKYKRQWKRALAMERDFLTLRNTFFASTTPSEVLSDEDSFYLLLTAERSSDVAQQYRALLKKEKPDFYTSDFGKFIQCLESNVRSKKKVRELTALTRSKHPVVSFESMILLAMEKVLARDPKSAEKLLRKAVSKNPFAGLPYLESFYIDELRFDRAIECCNEDFRKFRRPVSAVKLAELYLLSGEAEKIRSLLPKLSGNSKAEILTACYLEALIGLAANDAKTVSVNLGQIKGSFGTPVSALMELYDAVSSGDSAAVETVWKEFQKMPPFYDLPERGQQLMLARIGDLLSKGETAEAVKLLNLPGVDPTANRNIAEFFIADQYRKGKLEDAVLNKALGKYPDSTALLTVGAKYLHRKGDFQTSADLIHRVMKKLPPAEQYLMQAVQAANFAATGKTDDAAGILLNMLTERPDDPRVLLAACRFAEKNNRPGDMESICRTLTYAKSPLLPFAEGKQLMMQGDRPHALDRFEQLDAGHSGLLFEAAKILAENDRTAPAIRLYRKILKRTGSEKEIRPFVLVNLAELYMAENDLKSAGETAEEAWRMQPRHPAMQTCFAGVLRRQGKNTRVLEVITPPPARNDLKNPLRKLWIDAAEAELSRRDHVVTEASKKLCSTLLVIEPGSKIGQEFQRKITLSAGGK